MSKNKKSSLKSLDVHWIRKLIREEIEEQLGHRPFSATSPESRDNFWGDMPESTERRGPKRPTLRRDPEADNWRDDWMSEPLDPPMPRKGKKRSMESNEFYGERRMPPHMMEDWLGPMEERKPKRRR